MRHTFPASLIAIFVATAAVSGQQAHVNLDWNPHKNTQNLTPYGANLISPEVRDDRTVTFRLKAPDARTVALTGGPMLLAIGKGNTPIPFEKGADGVWTLTVGPVKPNLYVYRLLVDGVGGRRSEQHAHRASPISPATAPSSCMATARRTTTRSRCRTAPSRGTCTTPTCSTASARCTSTRRPTTIANRRYPVLYLLGGSGELASNWNIDGRAGFIADNLIAEGKALPMIIAMPNNQVVHRSDPKHTELTFPLFEKELRQHIVPLVDKSYSTQADPARPGASPACRWAAGTRSWSASRRSTCSRRSASSAPAIRSRRRARRSSSTIPRSTRRWTTSSSASARTRTSRPTAASCSTRFSRSTHVAHDYYVGGDGGHDWGTWRAHLVYMLPKLWRKSQEVGSRR